MALLHGDCREVMATMPESSVDAIVTDPPYELGFMGKAWDATGVAYQVALWQQAFRVLKPGGHLLAFGGSRTYHRLTCAVEDAGFEIRDQLQWLQGSGFPKSHNLHGEHEGWGTALKPAHEPIVLARKPLTGTVAANVERYGTGALNIDGCRIEGGVPSCTQGQSQNQGTIYGKDQRDRRQFIGSDLGRWPANVLLDDEAAVLLDAQSEVSVSKRADRGKGIDGATFRNPNGLNHGVRGHSDTGGASRFFYCAKASRSERNAGLDGMPEAPAGETSGRHDGTLGSITTSRNHHPTVKPVALMRWLVRLITPPDGLILDPFLGSGTTGIAAALEGFAFIGIEQDADYLEIARRRIAHVETPLESTVAD